MGLNFDPLGEAETPQCYLLALVPPPSFPHPHPPLPLLPVQFAQFHPLVSLDPQLPLLVAHLQH